MAIPTHLRLNFVIAGTAPSPTTTGRGRAAEKKAFRRAARPRAVARSAETGDVRKGNATIHAFIGGGFAEVTPDRVSILAPVAERAEDIDLARAEAAKRRAEERLAKPMADVDFERARISLLRAISRLDVAKARRRS